VKRIPVSAEGEERVGKRSDVGVSENVDKEKIEYA